jgi:oligopeptide transport system permease protein
VGRYISRRLLLTIPVLIGSSFLIFAMVYALPGDPIRALAGDRPLAPAVVAQLRDEYNLDDNLFVQYFKYIAGFFQGNFGTDFSGRPVLDTIERALPVTIKLTIVAVVFETIMGIAAGVLSALKLLVSVPVFVLGFIAQFTLGVKLGVFPISGINNGWSSYLLPGLVLASLSMAYVARLTRTSVAESMAADYIRTAKSKGISNRRIIVRHALRNSLIPVVTFIGADVGGLLGGAIVTETVFNLPGLGRAIYDALARQEGAVVVGIVTLFVFFYIFFNLVVDVLYAVLDPRIRYE